jgi:hypothetical protein
MKNKSGAKLETFPERRPVLEKLVDLNVAFDVAERTVEIAGKVAYSSPGRGIRPQGTEV